MQVAANATQLVYSCTSARRSASSCPSTSAQSLTWMLRTSPPPSCTLGTLYLFSLLSRPPLMYLYDTNGRIGRASGHSSPSSRARTTSTSCSLALVDSADSYGCIVRVYYIGVNVGLFCYGVFRPCFLLRWYFHFIFGQRCFPVHVCIWIQPEK